MLKKITSLLILSLVFLLTFNACFSDGASEKVKKIKVEAENGDAMAQYMLGGAYYFGDEVAIDNDKAFEWFEKSAQQNNDYAQYFLGVMYMNGDGVAQNFEQSFYWIKKSAEQNNIDAQYKLATIYDLGIGTIQDRRSALYWYDKSAKQGNEDAEYYLENMQGFIGQEILPNDKMSIQKCRVLAENDNDKAQLYLGLLYLNGIGVSKSMIQTKYWISKSMANGNVKAELIWDEHDLWKYKDLMD